MSFLELSSLTKRYGSQTVIDSLSLSVDKGTFVCLLGPSGCGKTTTLRLVAGFLEPDGGEIVVNGRRVSAPGATLAPEQRNMSMIFQSYALWPHMTIFDNVAYGLKLRKKKPDEIRNRVETILAATQLEAYAQRYPGELSGGQQQRVSLARALVVEPETLLLDEPLSNLDANLREEMRFEIRRLHDKFHYTTVYVTHDQAEAMTTADLIVVMNKGVIEQAGGPEDIYQRPVSEFVARFIGGSNILKGKWDGQETVDCGNGIALACGSGEFAQVGDTAVSVRHHDITLSAVKPDIAGKNWAQGVVERQSYLGPYRDYLVRLEGGTQVRVEAPVENKVARGEKVWLHFQPENCRALAR